MNVEKSQSTGSVHKLTVGELLSEVVPGFMEIMGVPMNGKLGYNIGKNWRYLQSLQKEVHAMNSEEISKHAQMEENGNVKMSVKEGGRGATPDYNSEESKKAYFDWYKEFTEKKVVELEYFPINSRELEAINGVKPATLTSLSFMFHE
jgi:hypothetical protein